MKTDGLAAGKGAIVCRSLEDADAAVAECMERRAFGASGETVVIEEFMVGDEASFFAIVGGSVAIPLGGARDHKTVFDGDRGPNTGGMGAYSPVPDLDEAMTARIMATIVRPTIEALAAEGRPYLGVLYVGLMLTADGPRVVEFNCRLGDPECQPIMMRLAGDLVPMIAAIARSETPPTAASGGWALGESSEAAVCVTIASGGYPGRYPTGLPIKGIDAAESKPGVLVFHAGTAWRDGELVTAGGRVLGVTAAGPTLDAAIARAYAAVHEIHFDGMHYRKDIGRSQHGPREWTRSPQEPARSSQERPRSSRETARG